MKTFILKRIHDSGISTTGVLSLDGKEVMRTLELPWKNNKSRQSCIPKGIYKVTRFNSPSKGKCFMLLNVDGRNHILIHVGNYPKDSLGCILVGIKHSQPDFVSHSRIALMSLDKIVGEDQFFTLIIQ